MIYATNILLVPLLILAWSIDAYLLLATARLILGRLSATRDGRFCQALREIVDPLPQRIERQLSACLHKPSPRWASWATVLIGGLIIRHLALMIILGVSNP